MNKKLSSSLLFLPFIIIQLFSGIPVMILLVILFYEINMWIGIVVCIPYFIGCTLVLMSKKVFYNDHSLEFINLFGKKESVLLTDIKSIRRFFDVLYAIELKDSRKIIYMMRLRDNFSFLFNSNGYVESVNQKILNQR